MQVGELLYPLDCAYTKTGDVVTQTVGVQLRIERSCVWAWVRHCCVTTLGKLFAPFCLCHQAE